MKAFKDTTGREWRIRLTLGSADRVLDLVGVDLLDPVGGEVPLMTRLRTDVRLLGKVLGELLETNGDRPLTVSELREAFDGPTKSAAWLAFREEWADFFREDGRADIATAIDRHESLVAEAVKLNELKVQETAIEFATRSGDSPES